MLRAPANLASVFGAALARGTATRGELIVATGLSKATVARMVEELHRTGLLAPASPPASPHGSKQESAARGRRPTALTVPPSIGQVIGVSLGLQRTGVLAVDLAGRERSWEAVATPSWSAVSEVVDWVAALIAAARAHTDAPVRRVAVAVPARIVNGTDVPNPPPSMAVLAGSDFARELSAAVGAPVVLDSDANMALDGLMAEGVVPRATHPVLLNMSTVLTIAVRRADGSAAPGLSNSFGNFSLLPFRTSEGESTLGALLSTQGLQDFYSKHGGAVESISELWGGDEWDTLASAGSRPDEDRGAVEAEGGGAGTLRAQAPPEHAAIRHVFTEALVAALRIVAVMADPPLVVLTGRLSPLAELVLPTVEQRLEAELDEPPQLVVASAQSRWHATAMGAAHIALRHVQRQLCEQLAAGTAPQH